RAAHQARLAETAKHYLSDVEHTLQTDGITVMTFIEYPPSGEAILETAKQQNVDLIVMSTRARTGLDRWVYGNTAETILREGTCPVLLLRK
ncbi:MAG: universal stress protein, partial [Ardenticatenaceae bacterium]